MVLPSLKARECTIFQSTSRDGHVSNPEHNGITNLYVMQPTTLGGSTDPQPGTLVCAAGLSMASQYTTLRLMDFTNTDWQFDLELVGPHRAGRQHLGTRTFVSGSGVSTGDVLTDGAVRRGRCAWPWPTRPARTYI